MELVFDIETNHYKFDILDRMHCIVAQDIESQKVYSFGPDKLHEGMELLMSADVLIGHNILLFDLPAIKQLYPLFNYTGEIRDTLIMSRMAKPKWFQHSLGKWGRTLHFKKGDYAEEYKIAAGEDYTEGDEWQTYSQDMLNYCVQDVRVNRRVYIECCKLMPRMFNSESLQLEQYIKTLMIKQRDEGIAFDQENATILMDKLMLRRTELAEEVSKTFKGFYKPGKLFTPKRDNARLGYTKGSTVQKIIWTDFNPNSRDHVTYWLQKKYNWEPEEFTDGGKPKVSETVLESLVSLYPEAAPIAEYFMVSKRLSAIIDGKGSWFNKVTTEGRIHGTVNSTGTVTYRGTHNNPNLGQIPKVGKPYGEECRSLFSHGMGDDWSFMGCDMSGIEFRLLAHYLHQFDGGALVDTVLNGDIHSVNQKAAGLPTRDLAKTFIYAFIYGGGDGKLGNIVGGDRAKGAKLRSSFLKGMPALATLLARVKDYRKDNKKSIRCLDGRHIPVDSEHVTLNYLLQTAGAILSKAWMREFHKLAEAAGFRWGVDYMQLLWVHDEVQCAVKTDRSEELGKICVQAIENVGEHYKLRCPITGEYKVGQNWAETH
jgi:DNA polymerase I